MEREQNEINLARETFSRFQYTIVLDGNQTVIYKAVDPEKPYQLWHFIILRPQFVCVYGDTQELILRPYSNNTPREVFDWIHRAGYDYMASKIPGTELRKAMSRSYDSTKAVAIARDWLVKHLDGEDQSVLEEFDDSIHDDMTAHDIQTLLYDLTEEWEYPELDQFDVHYLWVYASLQEMTSRARPPGA